MQITTLTPERRPEVFELLRICLGERATARRDELFWAWKHENNPFGSSMLLVGEEHGSLVGLRAFMLWKWQANGQSYLAVRAVDTVTHPDHQRKGIFSTLTHEGLALAKAAGMSFVFNTPNRNSMPGYLKMGWQHVARLPLQVKLLHPVRFAQAMFREKVLHKKSSALTSGADFLSKPLLVEKFLEDAPGMDELIRRDAALRGSGYTTARSVDFLGWRYGSHPYVNYHVECVREAGHVRAALVWRTNERFGLNEVMISDLFLESADYSLVDRLISDLRQKVRTDYLIAHFPTGSVHLALIKRAGFFSLPGQSINFTVRDIGGVTGLDPFRAENWSLCLGDLEIF